MTSEVEIPKPTRREKLYYLGGASILLLAGEIGFGLSKFINPPIALYGAATGIFKLTEDDLPHSEPYPTFYSEGKCWLENVEGGLIALDAHCPHETAFVKWVIVNDRYECPVCGSKFHKDGTYIEGPAKRSMDHIVLRVIKTGYPIVTPSNGDPVKTDGAQYIELDTNAIIPGKPRA